MEISAHIASQKDAPENLGRVLVLGLGKSGKAAISYLLPLLGDRVSALAVAAGAETSEAHAYLSSLGDVIAWEFGDDGVEKLCAQSGGEVSAVEACFDVCIASPGIAPTSQLYTQAQMTCAEVIGELEFAWRESAKDSVWVAVTGTNGKTTTTALLAHVLEGAFEGVSAVGNIGDPAIEAVARKQTQVYVVEASSYQLASTVYFAPNAAIILGITPDHLTWHGSFEAYAQAKLSLVSALAANPGSVVILDATNDVVREEVKRLRQKGTQAYVPLGGAAGITVDMRQACGSHMSAFVDENLMLRFGSGDECFELGSAQALQIKGAHNVLNALAAASAARVLGVPDEIIAAQLASFAPLEHRIEPCGSVCGVECFNDSKATNVDATLAAVAAFPGRDLVILLGGRDKFTDLEPLVEACFKHAKAVVLYGESRFRFLQAFSMAFNEGIGCPYALADTMKEALDEGLRMADVGDVLLLSPACASFDEFSCFEERGDVFKRLVEKRSREGMA